MLDIFLSNRITTPNWNAYHLSIAYYIIVLLRGLNISGHLTTLILQPKLHLKR